MEPPDSMDGGVMEANLASQGAGRPVGLPSRLGVEGLRDDTIDRLAVQAWPPSGARSVLLDSGEAKESKPSAPEADGPSVQVELLGNLIIGLPLDRSQDDASAVHEAMGGRTTPRPSEQLAGFLNRNRDGGRDSHCRGMVNPGYKGTYFSNSPLGARSLTRFPAGGDLLHGHCPVTPGLPGPFAPLNRGSPRAISSGYGSGTRASTPLRPSPSLGAGTAVTPVPA